MSALKCRCLPACASQTNGVQGSASSAARSGVVSHGVSAWVGAALVVLWLGLLAGVLLAVRTLPYDHRWGPEEPWQPVGMEKWGACNACFCAGRGNEERARAKRRGARAERVVSRVIGRG